MRKLRLTLASFVLTGLVALTACVAVAGAKPSSEPFIQTTLTCGGEEIPALITPGGNAVNFIVPDSSGVRIFVAVAASTAEQGQLFSLPAGALASLAKTRTIETCTFVGDLSGRHFTVTGFFA